VQCLEYVCKPTLRLRNLELYTIGVFLAPDTVDCQRWKRWVKMKGWTWIVECIEI
jgi:hypothetical protein